MTQIERIKEMLADNEWICGTRFMQEFIPEYRSRINEIRKQGFMVETRKCQQHNHKGNLQEWRRVSGSRQTQNSAITATQPSKDVVLTQIPLFPYSSDYSLNH